MSFLEIDDLRAAYARKPILKGIALRADAGSITGILGANGSGKTTLLKAICGILPHDGACILDGQPLEGLSPRQTAKLCSYVPQRSGIEIDISALDVVLMGFNPHLDILERPAADMRRRALHALDRVGLGEISESNYAALSEGQKQLCILARTLVSSGKLLLLDEPESALDFRFRNRTLALLRQWCDEGARCMLIALHDPQLALNHCDQLALISDGRIAEILRPKADSIEEMERALGRIYGAVRLMRCTNRQGRDQLVMLAEEEFQ